MGLPTLNIYFAAAATQTAYRINHGTVAVIIKESATAMQGKIFKIQTASAIPAGLATDNQKYIASIFAGNEYAPREVIICTVTKTSTDYTVAFRLLANERFDWLVAPADVDAPGGASIVQWVKDMRDEGGIQKAILPSQVADCEAIVNFTSTGIKSSIVTSSSSTTAGVTAGQYCARVAGYIAGTPLSKSITFGVLPDVSDFTRLSKAEMESAINAGQLILMHDGEKVKFAQGVTSITTITANKFPQMKKIKIVAALDTIRQDLRLLVQDRYIGKMPNSYDNKCLLVTAIQGYFKQLEREGILEEGSKAEIDVDAQRQYLVDKGVDISAMSDDDIKRANTGADVFIAASISVLDAIENIEIKISLDLG